MSIQSRKRNLLVAKSRSNVHSIDDNQSAANTPSKQSPLQKYSPLLAAIVTVITLPLVCLQLFLSIQATTLQNYLTIRSEFIPEVQQTSYEVKFSEASQRLYAEIVFENKGKHQVSLVHVGQSIQSCDGNTIAVIDPITFRATPIADVTFPIEVDLAQFYTIGAYSELGWNSYLDHLSGIAAKLLPVADFIPSEANHTSHMYVLIDDFLIYDPQLPQIQDVLVSDRYWAQFEPPLGIDSQETPTHYLFSSKVAGYLRYNVRHLVIIQNGNIYVSAFGGCPTMW